MYDNEISLLFKFSQSDKCFIITFFKATSETINTSLEKIIGRYVNSLQHYYKIII